MIWESTALMTIVDLLVIGVSARCLWLVIDAGPLIENWRAHTGRLAAALGLLMVLVFYGLDLAAMHLMPIFFLEATTEKFMANLHLNYSWVLVAGGLVLVATGFTTTDRKLRGVIRQLGESQIKHSKAEGFAQDLLDTSPVAIVVSSRDDGTLLMVNEMAARLHQLPAADLMKFRTGDFYLNPEDRTDVMRQLLEQGKLENVDIHAKRLGTGEECWFSLSALVIEFGGEEAVLSAVQDITEHKQLEAKLRDRQHDLEAEVSKRTSEIREAYKALEIEVSAHKRFESQYKTLLHAAPDPMVQVDLEGKIVEINKEAEQVFGYRRAELLGQSIEILVPHALREDHRTLRQQYAKDPKPRHMAAISDLVARCKDSREFPVEISLNPTTVADTPIVIASIRDISKRQRAETELKIRATILEEMVEGVNVVRTSDGMIVYSNPASDKILGYSQGELLGQHVSVKNGGEKKTQQKTFEEISGALRRDGSWRGVVHNKKKNGTSVWNSSAISTMEHPEFGHVWLNIFTDISERRKLEEKATRRAQELEKSEALLNEAQRIAKIGSWDWNIETNELAWSDEIYRMFGTEPQSFGATYEAFLEFVHPDDRQFVDDAAQRALHEKEEYSIDHRIVLGDGSEKIVHERAEVTFGPEGQPIRMTGTVQDVTSQRKLEQEVRDRAQELEKSEAILNEAQRIAKIGSWEWDIIANELWRSDEVYRMYGVDPKDFEGDLLRLAHPDDRQLVEHSIERAIQGQGEHDIDYRVVMSDGTERVMHAQAEVAFDAEARPIRMTGTVQDVTERRRVEKELMESHQRARRLQFDLHHVARVGAAGEMASTLAHELNQPLAALSNYVQAARKILEGGTAADREKVTEYMEQAVTQSSRASEIIRGLRKLVTKGEEEWSFEDINALIEEAMFLLSPEAKSRGIAMATELDPELPPIFVDKIRFHQVVFNLVRNGIEALSGTADGILCVGTTLTDDECVRVTVADNGPGFADEIRGQLFQSFVTTKPKGMGVGLSICRSIVQNHAGKIWTEDNPNGGTSLHFTLPISVEGAQDDG